jgi:tRNA-specific 2-thiouridylase
LRIGGRNDASDEPWYVVRKDLARNVLLVTQGHDHPAMLASSMEVAQLTWVAGRAPMTRFRCTAKVRYRQQDQPCEVTLESDAQCTVSFDEPQRAVTPGQYAVFYMADECLGGGVIERAA